MSLTSRRELLACASKRYAKASASDRRPILDEFVASTGYDRNYAIRLLNHPPALPAAKRGRRPRGKVYGPATQEALVRIWKIAGGICGKRLTPILPHLIESLERFGEIDLNPAIRKRLIAISPATCDRLLTKARADHPHGLCTTQPSPHLLLRSQIPVRTFADWDQEREQPGYFEIDLVAHAGDCGKGEFLYTLTATDIALAWTECAPLKTKSKIDVTQALSTIARRLPFSILGIDSDNGSEFINHHLVRYCDQHRITFTRCRPYKKNDQCRVEQKNGNIVRAMAGYSRFEGGRPLTILSALYEVLATTKTSSSRP